MRKCQMLNFAAKVWHLSCDCQEQHSHGHDLSLQHAPSLDLATRQILCKNRGSLLFQKFVPVSLRLSVLNPNCNSPCKIARLKLIFGRPEQQSCFWQVRNCEIHEYSLLQAHNYEQC